MRMTDVVPIEPSTVGLWVHPPYSGFYDGTWLWGRGSCDDKPDVVSILWVQIITSMSLCLPRSLLRTTVTSLLEQGFTPRRSFVLAFGIDEESAGYHACTLRSAFFFGLTALLGCLAHR